MRICTVDYVPYKCALVNEYLRYLFTFESKSLHNQLLFLLSPPQSPPPLTPQPAFVPLQLSSPAQPSPPAHMAKPRVKYLTAP